MDLRSTIVFGSLRRSTTELFRRNHQPQRVQAKARAAGDDEIASIEQRLVIFPRGNFEKLVRAHDEKQVIVGMLAVESPHRVDCIKHVGSSSIRWSFGEWTDETRMIRAAERDHGVTMHETASGQASFYAAAATTE